jgi:signal peptidase II
MLILCISFFIALSDQVTKHLVRTNIPLYLPPDERIVVIPGFFNLTYGQNTGAAWGIMSGFNHWLVALSIVMLVIIIVFRRHFLTESIMTRIAMGLMIGGIIGNLIDRMRLGYVVDFLDFYWNTYHFPSFNIADMAICSGVGLYIITHIRVNIPKVKT